MRICFVILFSVVFTANGHSTELIDITIEARAIESPIVKYRLLPPEANLKPGNAVPILLRLPWEETPWMSQEYPKLAKWAVLSLDDPEWNNAKLVLPEQFYAEIKRAA